MIDVALDNRVIIYNDFDEAIQELDVLFNTTNTELLGNPRFGTNWYQFLYECTPSPDELKKYVHEVINNFCIYTPKFNVDIDIDVMHDDNSTESIYVVIITLYKPTNKSTKRRKAYILR